MVNAGSYDDIVNVTIKRRSNKKPGFEVEKREEDGFYYITKVPKSCTEIAVGDRVLEINGTTYKNFKSQKDANDLVDSFQLDVVPVDDDEEEYEEVNRSRSKAKKNIPSTGWDDESYGNSNSNSNSEGKPSSAAGRKGINRNESWDREYVSKYKPRDRFMITVTNEENNGGSVGIDLVEYKNGEIYVSDVNDGPFYVTALNRGDKILSINGKKLPQHLDTVEEAMDVLESKSKLTVFVLRPSTEDKGLKWVLNNT